MMEYAPNPEQFIARLEETLKYCKEADDSGSIDREMARLQDWVKTWPPILDENGGL